MIRDTIKAALVSAMKGGDKAQVGTLRMLGSGTMDCMSIASGQFDVLFQHTVADWDRLPEAAIVRGAGGESVVVPAGGVDWTLTGAPVAVADVRAALSAGPDAR